MQHNQWPHLLGVYSFGLYALGPKHKKASVKSRKNIVSSVYSQLTYSETAVKRIPSTFSAHNLKLAINRGLFFQNIARGNLVND